MEPSWEEVELAQSWLWFCLVSFFVICFFRLLLWMVFFSKNLNRSLLDICKTTTPLGEFRCSSRVTMPSSQNLPHSADPYQYSVKPWLWFFFGE